MTNFSSSEGKTRSNPEQARYAYATKLCMCLCVQSNMVDAHVIIETLKSSYVQIITVSTIGIFYLKDTVDCGFSRL